ncbi:outer membrane lipoprotein carrier protein LolA [candidate division WOR-3 bacterium]|nr:outer membrane lipoprotein carrier protein LolA [candidate division WOR-3 bacterium]
MTFLLILFGFSPAADSFFDYLEKIDYFSSQYEETVFDSLTQSEYVFKGEIFLSRPKFFRMNVLYPEIQTLICDGDFLLVEIPSDDNRILIPLEDPQNNLPRPEKFIFGEREEFRETDITASVSSTTIELAPSSENDYFRKVEITFSNEDQTLLRLKIFTLDYGTRDMKFTPGTQRFSPIDDSFFQI